MKKYIFLAASALALASCSSDDFLGENPGNNPSSAQTAISFGGTTGKISRANKEGEAAASALGNSFYVYGTKKVSDTETQTVFKNYKVTYDNTNKWTYANNTDQYTKYWDYSALQYDFVAFSLAGNTKGEGEDNIKVEKIENQENQEYPTYTLKGKVSALKSCFIADPVSVEPGKYGKDVQFIFHSTGTKVCVGIYETIPGYSINNITFHKADESSSDQPVLYASTPCIPHEEGTGTLTIVFKNPVTSELTQDDNTTTETKTKNLEFSSFSVGTENKLGTERNTATKTGELSVTPIKITEGLTMKVDYTLVSDDGSGETIKITGATVKVPAQYTNLQANYIYTYIFNITENTNGSTGDGSPAGLYPIRFDAVVSENQSNSQTTVTEFNKDGGDNTEDITNEGN